MGLDVDTNYFALPDDAAGTSLGNTNAALGLTSALDPNTDPSTTGQLSPGTASFISMLSQVSGQAAPGAASTIAAKIALGTAQAGSQVASTAAPAAVADPGVADPGTNLTAAGGSAGPALQALAQGLGSPSGPMVPMAGNASSNGSTTAPGNGSAIAALQHFPDRCHAQ